MNKTLLVLAFVPGLLGLWAMPDGPWWRELLAIWLLMWMGNLLEAGFGGKK